MLFRPTHLLLADSSSSSRAFKPDRATNWNSFGNFDFFAGKRHIDGGFYIPLGDCFSLRAIVQRAHVDNLAVLVEHKELGSTFRPVIFCNLLRFIKKIRFLSKYAFSPDAFKSSSGIFNKLQKERRGWSGTKDPDLHDMFLNMQKNLLDHLLKEHSFLGCWSQNSLG